MCASVGRAHGYVNECGAWVCKGFMVVCKYKIHMTPAVGPDAVPWVTVGGM